MAASTSSTAEKGNDTIDGGAGVDYLYFFGTAGPDEITAAAGSGTLTTAAETDGYTGIEQFILRGLGGDDRITASGARDFLIGSEGADTLTGGGDGDVFEGEDGDDTIVGGDGGDFATGGPGNDVLNGGGGVDGMSGDDGNDTLDGGDRTDTLDGGPGDDTLRGGPFDDTLNAFAGSDMLDGQGDGDRHVVAFGALGAVTVADSGGEGIDSLQVRDCSGVAVTGTQASRGAETVNYSGVEVAPCGFAPPPPPPPPPAPPPPTVRPPTVRCVVPNVKRKTLVRARRMLIAKRCRLGTVRRAYSAKVRRGRIISQTRRPGARLPRGAKVGVKVSRGKRR